MSDIEYGIQSWNNFNEEQIAPPFVEIIGYIDIDKPSGHFVMQQVDFNRTLFFFETVIQNNDNPSTKIPMVAFYPIYRHDTENQQVIGFFWEQFIFSSSDRDMVQSWFETSTIRVFIGYY